MTITDRIMREMMPNTPGEPEVEDARMMTCNAADLSMHTSKGWVVRETLNEDVFETPMGGHHGANGQWVTHKPKRMRRLVFLLARSRDTELVETRAELEKLRESLRISNLVKEGAEAELKGMKRDCEEAKTFIEKSRATLAANIRNAEEKDALNRRIEEDIAKLIAEVGSARYREIVGR